MLIHIFGASGSGTTTLAQAFAKQTDFVHLDADDFYWKTTQPPYQEKVPLEERNKKLRLAILPNPKVVLSGSLVSWGEAWQQQFGLAVFLYLPPEIRMDRLRKRERARYGNLLDHDRKTQEATQAFLEWAAKYDDLNFNGRSLHIHQQWMRQLTCPVLRLEGAMEVEEKVSHMLQQLKTMGK